MLGRVSYSDFIFKVLDGPHTVDSRRFVLWQKGKRMTKIETVIDYEQDLTINIISGELTIQKILDQFEYYYQGVTTKQILCDLTNADWSNISTSELRMAIAKLKKYSRKGGQTAMVFSREADFGIGRMLEVFAEIERYDFEFKSFRERVDADQWLGVQT